MPVGAGGKYDRQAEAVLHETGADLVLLIVIGARGPGFSVCCRAPEGAQLLHQIPDVLVEVSESVRADLKDPQLYPGSDA